MIRYLPDTHAVFWFETANPKLSVAATRVFRQAELGEARLVLHPIVLAEFSALLRKLGRGDAFPAYLRHVQASSCYEFVTLGPEEVLAAHALDAVPEIHDRLIVASAIRLGAPLVSSDAVLQACGVVKVVW